MATFERHEGRNLKGIDLDTKDRDLEQYGVWVKAEPQDVFEESEGSVSTPVFGGLKTKAVQDESFLSDEDKSFLSALEEPSKTTDEDFSVDSGIPSLESKEASISIPELEEEPLTEPDDIPDITKFESMDDLGVPIEEFSPSSSSEKATSGEKLPDISDFTMEEPSAVLEESTETDFEPIDIDLKFDDTLPPRPSAQDGAAPEKSSASPTSFEPVTDFDDFINSPESQESSLMEVGEPELPGESQAGIDLSTKEDDFTLDDIPPLSKEMAIDDVAEVEKELSTPVDHLRESGATKQDASSDILLKIAGELSSIKQELVSLKTQISAMKAESEEPHPEIAAEGKKSETGKARGFFDEEEDETIALTGDELDNILNTAEFSEESADMHLADTGMAAEESQGDLLPESGDYENGKPNDESEPAIEEIRLETAEDLTPTPPTEDTIAALATEGVSPLTPAPEDTSYLEEEVEDLSLSSGEELPEAPLLEPAPEDLEIDELTEDRFDDAEELPLAEFETPQDLKEPADLIEESEELEELTLDVDSEPSNIVLESPERVEMPIPEVESNQAPSAEEPFEEFVEDIPVEENADGLGEIALHNEESIPADIPAPAEESIAEEVSDAIPMEAEEPASVAPEDLLVEDHEPQAKNAEPVPNHIKDEVRSVLSYLDKLLESLPEEKIEEFAKSEHFETYKRLFEELGLV
jgi:pilus assembly protein FimV